MKKDLLQKLNSVRLTNQQCLDPEGSQEVFIWIVLKALLCSHEVKVKQVGLKPDSANGFVMNWKAVKGKYITL